MMQEISKVDSIKINCWNCDTVAMIKVGSISNQFEKKKYNCFNCDSDLTNYAFEAMQDAKKYNVLVQRMNELAETSFVLSSTDSH